MIYTIIKIVIKSCLLPVHLDKEKAVVKFKLLSAPTMLHVLLFWIPHITVGSIFWYTLQKNGTVQGFMENSFATTSSGFGTVLVFLAIFYVIPLAMRLDSIPTRMILEENMLFPKYGTQNIIGFFGLALGGIFYIQGIIGNSSTDDAYDYWLKVGCNAFCVSSQSLVWCIFSIIIPVWMENVMRVHSIDAVKDAKIFVKSYNLLFGALENYFLQYFTTLQIIIIATLFLMISKVISEVNKSFAKIG